MKTVNKIWKVVGLSIVSMVMALWLVVPSAAASETLCIIYTYSKAENYCAIGATKSSKFELDTQYKSQGFLYIYLDDKYTSELTEYMEKVCKIPKINVECD